MRGNTSEQVEILLTLTPNHLIPADHPIRRIKAIVDLTPAKAGCGILACVGSPP
jgi:hypothetical protein